MLGHVHTAARLLTPQSTFIRLAQLGIEPDENDISHLTTPRLGASSKIEHLLKLTEVDMRFNPDRKFTDLPDLIVPFFHKASGERRFLPLRFTEVNFDRGQQADGPLKEAITDLARSIVLMAENGGVLGELALDLEFFPQGNYLHHPAYERVRNAVMAVPYMGGVNFDPHNSHQVANMYRIPHGPQGHGSFDTQMLARSHHDQIEAISDMVSIETATLANYITSRLESHLVTRAHLIRASIQTDKGPDELQIWLALYLDGKNAEASLSTVAHPCQYDEGYKDAIGGVMTYWPGATGAFTDAAPSHEYFFDLRFGQDRGWLMVEMLSEQKLKQAIEKQLGDAFPWFKDALTVEFTNYPKR